METSAERVYESRFIALTVSTECLHKQERKQKHIMSGIFSKISSPFINFFCYFRLLAMLIEKEKLHAIVRQNKNMPRSNIYVM